MVLLDQSASLREVLIGPYLHEQAEIDQGQSWGSSEAWTIVDVDSVAVLSDHIIQVLGSME